MKPIYKSMTGSDSPVANHPNQKSQHPIQHRLLFLLFCAVFSFSAHAQGTWTALTNPAPNANQGVLFLLSDGTVLCKTGGGGGSGFIYNKLTPTTTGSYSSGTWTSIASMIDDRRFYSSQMLQDGRMYVCGGEYGAGGFNGEIYNPLTNTWTATPSQASFVSDANSEILEDGRVLQAIVGGTQRTCRLYNPATNTYTNAGSTIGSHNECTWHKLPDGTILMIPKNGFTSERYFPATNTWVTDAVCPVQLYSDFGSEIGGAAMLPDGRIWFVGGRENTAFYTPSGTNAIGSWTAGPDIPNNYGQPDGPVSVLRDGKVLFTASPRPISGAGGVFQSPTRFYEFDPIANTYLLLTAPNGAANLPGNTCYETNFVNLPNGQILYGLMGSTQYYVYTPAGSASASWKPVITANSLSSDCNSYSIRGIRFNGISCGSIYGDDWQMNTNWPIVRLQSGATNDYARTFNWNSTGVDRGNAADTVEFTLPAGLANGTWNLTVTANGITSNAISFNTYPSLTSDLTPPTICSGNAFTYSPVFDRGCVSDTWTRAAVVGISNPAVTTPQSSNPNEVLINTTSTPKTVVYVYSMSHNGYSNTQNVSVIVNPTPSVGILSFTTSICNGDSITYNALGATTYTWDPGFATGTPVTFSPSGTTTYTVTGTNTYGCSDAATRTVYVNQLPTVTSSTTDNDLCPGQSTNLSSSASSIEHDSLMTTLEGGNGFSANVFDVHANETITITDFKMNIAAGTADSAEVWYNPGGYGNANVTSQTGWFKLGATVPIVNLGAGNLTLIPTTANITIAAGSTYGFIVACNGSNLYTDGTLVGSMYVASPDLNITEGHGGSAFGGTFSLTNSPRVFNGEIVYNINNGISGYAWTPAAQVTSPTSSNTVATPSATTTAITTYTISATDGNGCVGTSSVDIHTNDLPSFNHITATPASICPGGNSQLTTSIATSESSQFLLTTLAGGNSFAGNAFDITANKPIRITNIRMNIGSGDSAEVWYKAGGYGNANLSSSTGWTKLGNTVAITAAGSGNLTTIPTTANLDISPGQTFGIVVVCNGTAYYTNGNAVGNIAAQNPDLILREGHGGSGFGGVFNFINSPRIFNGQIDYLVFNDVVSYSWSPSADLTNYSISNPVADPHHTTTYTLTVTDINGCTNTGTRKLFVDPLPQVVTSVTPTAICPGDSAQLVVTPSVSEMDSLFTTVGGTNGFGPNGGVVFDITTSKPVVLQQFKMDIDAGATQAKVYYKAGGYGNANVTSTLGWTQLGSTITIVPAGAGNLTNIPLNAFLSIPASTTYGIIVTTDGDVNYSNGTAVGTIVASNPDLSIKEGHGGSGFTGVFNFTNSPRVFNGEVVYQVSNTPYTVQWSPNTNMNNAFLTNPKVAPLSNTIYNVTVTDVNGCIGTGSAGVNISPLPTLGTATASPSSLCLGANVSLSYTQPAGLSCNGAFQSGFAGTYAPANWTTTLTNSNGTVNTASAPNSISLTSGNNGSGLNGQTIYSIVVPCTGYISFNWDYTTNDGAQFDFPRYTINGGTPIIFPTYQAQNGDPNDQVGSFNLLVTAGQTFAIQAHSSDNVGGACTITITNFKAPYQTLSGQSVTWFSAPSGGSNLGNGNPQTHTPATASNFIYYAQVSSSVTGCTNTNRSATNLVIVNALPNVTVSATQTTICATSSTTLTAANASSYSWQPGGLTGNSVVVTPATTTTYTVTGTGANGCTKTATITIIVNPQPVITGSASPGIVCPGGPVTLTGTTAGVTWNWQPGNLNGTPVIVNPLVQTTYTVTATSAAGCTKTQTFVILMHPTPTVTTSVAPSATFCAGGNATITANSATATGYTWQPGGGVGANLIVTLANTYTVTATNAQGCTGTATRVITVNSLPTVGITTSVNPVCAGSSTTLTGTGAVSYVWNPGALSGTSVVVSPVSATTYTVIGTNANGCTNTSTVTIGIASLPSVSITPAAAITLCAGQSTALTGNGGLTYSWNPGGLTGTVVNVSPLATTTYTVVGTNANGCNSSSTKLVTVNPLPSVGTTVTPASASICAGSSATITGTGANTYTWQPGALSGASIIVTLANTYTVTGTNTSTGCTNTSTRLITVNSLPSIGTTATATTICSGVTTSITGTGGSTYTWQPGGLSGTTINVSPATTTTYTVTGTNANGCTNTATRLITVLNSPTVGTNVTNASICLGQSTTITGTGASTYSWQPGALNGTSINVSPASTTTYTVTGTAANGCTKTATRTITVNTPSVTATVITNPNICIGNSAIIQAGGAVNYVWQPGGSTNTSITVSPIVTTTYTVTGTNASGCTATATATITVSPICNSTLNIKLYIEGYYLGAGLMTPALQNQGVAGATPTLTDTITVELRNSTPPYAVANSIKTLLNTNGTATCLFSTTGTYYLVVKHRNGLETWSANPITVTGAPSTYDFSDAANKAYGSNQQTLGGGVFGIYSGDLNADENIDLGDLSILENDIVLFSFGYFASDINGDGNVDILDSPTEEANIINFIFSMHP